VGSSGLFGLGDPDVPAQKQRHAPVQVIDGNYEMTIALVGRHARN
jgi:hypothetical protein